MKLSAAAALVAMLLTAVPLAAGAANVHTGCRVLIVDTCQIVTLTHDEVRILVVAGVASLVCAEGRGPGGASPRRTFRVANNCSMLGWGLMFTPGG
jgi:hypothetical protein